MNKISVGLCGKSNYTRITYANKSINLYFDCFISKNQNLCEKFGKKETTVKCLLKFKK